jgi:hypothetical protein
MHREFLRTVSLVLMLLGGTSVAPAQQLWKAGGELGPGAVHRVVAELQRRFILAPDLDLRPRASGPPPAREFTNKPCAFLGTG